MIKINLLGTEAAVDHSGQLFYAGYAVSLVLFLVACFFLQTSIRGEIDTLTAERQSLDRELTSLKEVTKEVRDLDKKREDLRNKLSEIALLNKNKTGPVRVMDSLNGALPERAWLMELSENNGVMKVDGLALDNVTVASFAKQLNTLSYFPKVENLKSESYNWKGASIQKFTFNAAVNYAGKILDPEAATAALEGEKLGEKPGEKTSKERA